MAIESFEPLDIPKSNLVFVIRKLTRAQTINVLNAADIRRVRLRKDLLTKTRRGVPDQYGTRLLANQDEDFDEVGLHELVSHSLFRHVLLEILDDQSKMQAIIRRIVLTIAELLADKELSEMASRPEMPVLRQAGREIKTSVINAELIESIKRDPKYFKRIAKELIAANQL